MSKNWVATDQTKPGVSGTSPSINDDISKVFHPEDPRYVTIDITGGLTNFKLQGRTMDGAWRDIKTQAAGTRLVFIASSDTDLLEEQLRVVALASANVDAVRVTRKY